MVDVVVIGGGPAGVTAALRARELGASVALIERGRLGGTCTNDGCVPTRVLAHAARLVRESEQFALYGLDGKRPTVDIAQVLQRAGHVVYQIQEKKQLIGHLQDVEVDLIEGGGAAKFADAHHVVTEDGRTIEGEKIIICAGGSPRKLPFPGVELTMTHSDIWTMTSLPKSMAIVGSGATGCQVASVMQAFGVAVTLLDVAPRVLPGEDEDVSRVMHGALQANGITVITGIGGVDRVEKTMDGLRMFYKIGDEVRSLDSGAVMLSVGWPGNLDPLNLGAAGVETKGAYILVNDSLQTSAAHIYAAGDINGRMMLVQTAASQAMMAAENAVLNEARADKSGIIPHGGFTDPEYGSVGLTEEQARKQGSNFVIATVPYADMDRAVIDDRTIGFCKLMADRATRQVIGVHVVGEQAVEVVQIVATAMAGEMPIEKLAQVEYAYPTFASIIGVAARQLARDLGVVQVIPWWREGSRRMAEWERGTT